MVMKEALLVVVLVLLTSQDGNAQCSGECDRCSAGFTLMDGKCYKFVGGARDYNSAKAECQKDNAYVAMPKSANENAILLAIRDENKEKLWLWIGLGDKTKEGTFVWDDGSIYNKAEDYGNWYKGEPNQSGDEDCVHIWHHKQWNDKSCANKDINTVICEKACLEKKTCPAGWTRKGDMCYKYDARKVGYARAQKICKSAGGDLIMPKTQRDLNTVIAIRNAGGSKNFLWIGLNDIKTEGTFIWDDGTSLAGGKQSPFWREAQPNNYDKGEDCGHIWKDDKLNDSPCNSKISSIMCQKAASVTGSGVNALFNTHYSAFNHDYGVIKTSLFAKTKDEAQMICEKFGGFLPEVESLDNLAKLASIAPGEIVWMNAVHRSPNNKYYWPEMGEEVDSSLWDTNEPNMLNTEFCTIMMDNVKKHHMHNIICNLKGHKIPVRVVCTFRL